MSRTERQHYVPAFYLKQWATPPERDGELNVFDRTSGRPRRSTPDRAAFARDFYLVDLRDAPQIAEDALAKLEALSAPAIREVVATNEIPADDDMRPLLAFVAIQAARTPRVRENLSNFYDGMYKRVLDAHLSDAQAFAALAREVEPGIADAEIEKRRRDFQELIDRPGTRVQMDQTTLIRDTLQIAPEIEDQLYRRSWQLRVAPEGSQFITSDDPVVLDFESGAMPSFLNSPGFGRADTIVSLVLGPRHLIVGTSWEPVTRRRELSREQVARYNTRAAFNGVRFLYYGGDGFDFLGPDDQLARGPAEVLRLPEDDEPRDSQVD